jgi:FixJ family two-component response regulator
MNNSTEKVYLVDDDTGVRESVSGFLCSYGITVVCFASAAEYLEYRRSDSASCLVLDLQMPGINGLELQRQLAEEDPPPIIFISGRGDVPSTAQAMKAGAIEFLTKPVDPNALIPAVTAALERDRASRTRKAELERLRTRFGQLSPRERDVLPLIVKGLLNKQSAAELGIAEVTLQIHRSQIMRKMDAGSFAELVRMASKLGIPAVA